MKKRKVTNRAIVSDFKSGMSIADVAKKYGLHAATVEAVIRDWLTSGKVLRVPGRKRR